MKRLGGIIYCVFCFIIFIYPSYIEGQTNVSGTITTNTLWDLSSSPYIVTGSVTVANGAQLTIEPGVIIKFSAGTGLSIDGEINARGTSDKQILFTSISLNPTPGDWAYIYFSENSKQNVYSGKNYSGGCILEYCTIEYAGSNSGSLFLEKRAAPFLKDIIIRYSNSDGIYSENYRDQIGVQIIPVVNSLIINNKSYGIYACWSSSWALFNTTLSQNGGVGLLGDTYSSASFDSCTISNNSVGISLWSNVVISNSIIANNSNDGIDLPSYMSVSNIRAYNCNFFNNGGAAINLYGDKGVSTIQGCIFAGNGTDILYNPKPTRESSGNGPIKNNIFIDSKSCQSINFIMSNAPAIQITNNVFISNSTNAILCTQNDVQFSNNLVICSNSESTQNGKLVFLKAPSVFNQNNLLNNTKTFDIYDNIGTSSGDINASNNYWNTLNTDSVRARIYDWYIDSTKSKVNYLPILSFPNTSAPISPPLPVAKAQAPGGVKIQWKANKESDLAGYKIYWGNYTGYSFLNCVDVGNVTTYILNGAQINDTIAVTAYDKGATSTNAQCMGNESWFSIAVSGYLNLLSPTGGEKWLSTSQQTIKWENFGVTNIKIEYSSNNGTTWNTIADSYSASAENYIWTTPDSFSGSCKIRISDASNASIHDVSPGTFSVIGVKLLAPNGGEYWRAGFVKYITWACGGASNIKLEYSTDNGSTWNIVIDTIPASSGSYAWTIPSLIFTQCLVRATDLPTGNSDISDNTFTIATSNSWQIQITENDIGNATQTLNFGLDSTATDGLDPSLGEVSLPPPPPGNFIDARFALPNNIDYSLKDFRSDTNRYVTWILSFQAGTGYSLTFTWNHAALPSGTFIISDRITGELIHTDMKTTDSLIISTSAYSSLKITYFKQISKDVSLSSGWNLFGIPLKAADMSSTALLPSAVSPVYGYTTAYNTVATLVNGTGYWVRYPAGVNTIWGDQVKSTTIPLVTGWNMVSVYDVEAPVTALTTTPNGILSSFFFGFNNGYSIPTTLLPGKGYWIRASQPGVIKLGYTPKIIAQPNAIDPKWHTIKITDAAGCTASLYLATSPVATVNYGLPPVPPAGLFDVRFASQTSVENSTEVRKDILIRGAMYPVVLSVCGVDLKVKDNVTGKLINSIVKAGSSITIPNANITIIEVIPDYKSVTYELQQNFPNPFNPTTTIKYSVPEKTLIKLNVYNQLGQQVVALINEVKDAGTYSIEWNAANLASGVYFYELCTPNFRSVKKLLLMK